MAAHYRASCLTNLPSPSPTRITPWVATDGRISDEYARPRAIPGTMASRQTPTRTAPTNWASPSSDLFRLSNDDINATSVAEANGAPDRAASFFLPDSFDHDSNRGGSPGAFLRRHRCMLASITISLVILVAAIIGIVIAARVLDPASSQHGITNSNGPDHRKEGSS